MFDVGGQIMIRTWVPHCLLLEKSLSTVPWKSITPRLGSPSEPRCCFSHDVRSQLVESQGIDRDASLLFRCSQPCQDDDIEDGMRCNIHSDTIKSVWRFTCSAGTSNNMLRQVQVGAAYDRKGWRLLTSDQVKKEGLLGGLAYQEVR